MTPVDIDKLKELLQRATPGPWDDRLWDDCIVTAEHRVDNLIACSPVHDRFPSSAVGWINNAALIVAAVNALPFLIAKAERVERLKRLVERAQLNVPDCYTTWHEDARNALSPTTTEDQHG